MDPFQTGLHWVDLSFKPFDPYDKSAENRTLAASFIQRAEEAYEEGVADGEERGRWPVWPEVPEAEANEEVGGSLCYMFA